MWCPKTGGIQVEKFTNGRQEVCVQSLWFEVLSVIHMMATLTEANTMLISNDQSTSSSRIVLSDSMRNAVELLLKAAGYLELLIRDVLVHLPPDIRSRLPKDLHEGTLEAISVQALAQGLRNMPNSKASIGVKLMGHPDYEKILAAAKKKYPADEAEDKGMEFTTKILNKLKDQSWFPVENIKVG